MIDQMIEHVADVIKQGGAEEVARYLTGLMFWNLVNTFIIVCLMFGKADKK